MRISTEDQMANEWMLRKKIPTLAPGSSPLSRGLLHTRPNTPLDFIVLQSQSSLCCSYSNLSPLHPRLNRHHLVRNTLFISGFQASTPAKKPHRAWESQKSISAFQSPGAGASPTLHGKKMPIGLGDSTSQDGHSSLSSPALVIPIRPNLMVQ